MLFVQFVLEWVCSVAQADRVYRSGDKRVPLAVMDDCTYNKIS